MVDPTTQTAAARYAQLKPNRKDAETRAKRCAKVTLPRLWIDEGARTRQPGSAFIDTGPKCINSLSAKVLLAWFPPNAGTFKLAPDLADAEDIAEQAGVETSEVELALSEVERLTINDIETTGLRSTMSEVAKHLLVNGNICIYDPDDGPAKFYPLTSYVVDRDGLGNLLDLVTLDKIAPTNLPEGMREAVMREVASKAQGDRKAVNTDVDLYTWVRLSDDGTEWIVHQEVEGFIVPDSESTYPKDASPWTVVAVPRSSVEDYGEGLVWDYVGSFESLEALRRAIRKGAAALAKIVLMVKPTSPIKEKQLASAESGAIIRGDANDVTALQLQKTIDLNFARQEADALAQSLELIFGVRSAVQRAGERVTAYEIRVMSQELDDSLGGFYSLTAEQLLLPLVRRRIAKLQAQGRLPELPAELLKPRITVGMAALGRGHDLTKLMEFGQAFREMVGDEEARRRLNSNEVGLRLAAASDITAKGMLRSDDELGDEDQTAAMREGMVRAAPQLAAGMMPPQATPTL